MVLKKAAIAGLSFCSLATLLLLSLGACSNEQAESTPEAVVQQYAQWVNNGQLEQAKSLCTPAAVAYLDALAAVIEAAETTPDSSLIKIEGIKCTLATDGQTAHCEGNIDDGYERYTEQFFLSQHNGQWLVDHKPESGTMHSSEEVLEEDEETIDK